MVLSEYPNFAALLENPLGNEKKLAVVGHLWKIYMLKTGSMIFAVIVCKNHGLHTYCTSRRCLSVEGPPKNVINPPLASFVVTSAQSSFGWKLSFS